MCCEYFHECSLSHYHKYFLHPPPAVTDPIASNYYITRCNCALKDGRDTQQQGALVSLYSRLLLAIKLPLSCSVTILIFLHKLFVVESKNKSFQTLLSVLSNCKNEYLMMCLLPATSEFLTSSTHSPILKS